MVSFDDYSRARSVSLIDAYLQIHHREKECRTAEILEFQKKSSPERVKQFRCIEPAYFLGMSINRKKQRCYLLSLDKEAPVAKFKVGDFLKLSLSSSGSSQIQNGFSIILDSYEPEKGTLSIRSLSPKLSLSKNQRYALDENATDWNASKVERVLTLLKTRTFRPDLIKMLLGHTKSFVISKENWVKQWYSSHAQKAKLNAKQKKRVNVAISRKNRIDRRPSRNRENALIDMDAICAYSICPIS